jgi:hypothetical protein
MPTTYYLMVKTHKITGLQYLCQTKKKDPFRYLGSGKYWRRHLKENGRTIDTKIIVKCYTEAALKEWGIYYSNLWRVVESKKWANLMEERGVGGGMIAGSDAAERSGSKLRDPTVYHFIHTDGREERLTQYEMYTKHELSFRLVNKLVKGRAKTAHGWSLFGTDLRYRGLDSIIYHFIHRDGREEQLTQYEMYTKHNLVQTSINMVVNNRLKSTRGWRLITTDERDTGQAVIARKSRDPTIYHFIHTDGREERLTQYEMYTKYELNNQNINSLIKGGRKSTGGWKLKRD